MTRRYAAYLLRHWVLADGRERVEVQRLPSGEASRFGSLAEACDAIQQQRPTGEATERRGEASPSAGESGE